MDLRDFGLDLCLVDGYLDGFWMDVAWSFVFFCLCFLDFLNFMTFLKLMAHSWGSLWQSSCRVWQGYGKTVARLWLSYGKVLETFHGRV